jgi:hypothetical protein
MTKTQRLSFLLLLVSVLTPFTARAAFQLTTPVRGEPTTLMVSPGFSFADMLRAEVGFAVSFPDLGGGIPASTDIQIRPALVLAPPAFPLYFRVFGVVDRIINGVRLLPGAAIGLSFGVDTVSIFFEAGALPRFTGAGTDFLLEPRGGVMFSF